MVDLYHSRSTKFRKVLYWNRKETNIYNLDKYVLETKPSGMFYAEEVSNIGTQARDVMGQILYHDVGQIALKTNDHIDIQNGSLVQYLGKVWTVDNIEQTIDKSESEYLEGIYETIISIRR